MGAAWCYLTAEVRRRPNLTIMGESVERIVFEGTRATGVMARHGGALSRIDAAAARCSRQRC
jgi:choline dehydrogenase-like flavoprotein